MSFLSNYKTFTDANEAHPNFHLFSALVALSSLISRRCWIEQGYFDVHPNIYVTLVGPPASRKTTAMSVCKRLLRTFKEDVPMSAECQTKEALLKDLVSFQRTFKPKGVEQPMIYTPMTICVTELSQFLGANSAHMVDFLTTIYDEPEYKNSTKNKGVETIEGPYISMLACTTPSWITNYMKADVISGGFARRCLFVYEQDKAKKIAFPEITDDMTTAWESVISHSKELIKLSGKFTWEPEARSFYENWYNNHKIPADEMLLGYYDSKHIQVLKIGMLVAASEGCELVMRKQYLEFALDLLALLEANLGKVFQGIGRNELHSIAEKLCDILSMAPEKRLSEKQVKRELFREADPREISSVIQHLTSTDRITRTFEADAATGVQKVYIGLK